MNDILQSYLAHIRVHSKASSVQTAEIHAAKFRAAFDAVPTRAEVDCYVADRLQHVKPVTVNGELAILRAALRFAGYGAAQVKMLKVGRRIPRVLDREQVKALLRCAEGPYRLMCGLAAYAGLRRGEIVRMQWADLDFENELVSVTSKEGWVPKSHHEREIPMGPSLRMLAVGYKRGSPTDWVFPGLEGGHLNEVSVNGPVREAFQAAGLYDPSAKPGLHMLRRTFATMVLGHADLETVRQLGGWADLKTVQCYVTSTDERKRRAVEGL